MLKIRSEQLKNHPKKGPSLRMGIDQMPFSPCRSIHQPNALCPKIHFEKGLGRSAKNERPKKSPVLWEPNVRSKRLAFHLLLGPLRSLIQPLGVGVGVPLAEFVEKFLPQIFLFSSHSLSFFWGWLCILYVDLSPTKKSPKLFPVRERKFAGFSIRDE